MPGRWKLGPGGAYYDSQDTGPNQVDPPPPAAAAAPVAPQPGGYDGSGIGAGLPGTGGVQTPQGQGYVDNAQPAYMENGQQWYGRKGGGETTFSTTAPGAGPTDMPSRMGPMVLQPGEGGMWGMNGGAPMSFKDMLAAIRAQYGGAQMNGGGVMGAIMRAPQAVPKPSTGLVGRAMNAAGGAIGSAGSAMTPLAGLMGGLKKPW